MRITRRSLFRGIGAGTAAIFARPLLREAFAAGEVPKRVVFLYMPNCNIRANWLPDGGRTPSMNQGDAKQFTLKSANTALEPVRNQTTIVTGMELKRIGGDPHGSGIIRWMTGGTIRAGEGARDPGVGTLGEGNLPVMPSVDQVLEDKSPLLKGTPYRSLQFAADTRADDGRTDIHLRVMSYDLKMTPMPPDIEPSKTYARLFGNLMPGTGGAPDREQAVQRTLAEEKSVLDYIKGDLGRLSQRLPAAQKPKLEHHLESVFEYERTLMRGTGAPPPADVPKSIEEVKANVSANHGKLMEQYLNITKLALQLDLTRVVSFMFGSGNSQVSMGDFVAGQGKGGLHPIAHGYKAAQLTAATNWYCGAVAGFVQQLAMLKESDGSSLLDNAIVNMASEVGQYHEHNNIPFVLFGGSKLGLAGGRCLNYPGRTPSDVWVPLAAAFGVQLQTFGDPKYNMGPLPELFG